MIGALVLHNNASNPNEIDNLFSSVFEGYEVTYSTDTDVFSSVLPSSLKEINSGFFVIGNRIDTEKSYPIAIPMKGSSAIAWFNGFVANKDEISTFTGMPDHKEDGYSPAKLLIKLNSNKHPDLSGLELNYTKLIKERVVSKLTGIYSMTLAYLTMNNRSRIILATKMKDMYFYLAYTNDYYVLFWTDEHSLFNSLKNTGAFIYGMTPLSNDGILVIHPIFLISKWRKWRAKNSKSSGSLKAVSILESYLARNTVSHEIEPVL